MSRELQASRQKGNQVDYAEKWPGDHGGAIANFGVVFALVSQGMGGARALCGSSMMKPPGVEAQPAARAPAG
jgi:hypothetical protein